VLAGEGPSITRRGDLRLDPCADCPLKDRPCISGEYRNGEYVDPEPRPTSVMVLAAAGGFTEEQQGRPLVGPSGAELDRALHKAGITEAYFTNAASCIPPDYGEPDKLTVRACRPRLEEQIRAVRPKFILTLGNVAVQRMLGRGQISSVSGKEQWSPKYGAWILPAFHPAYILRGVGKRAAWELDLLRYGHLIRGDIPLPGKPPIRVSIVESEGELRDLSGRLRMEALAFDFETNGLPWWHTDFKATCVGFAFDGAESTVLFLDHPDNPLDPRVCMEELSRLPVGSSHEQPALLPGPRPRIVGHNAGMFDCLVWYRLTGQIPYLTHDTMVMAHLLDENEPKGLKWQGRAKLGWPDWDIKLEEKTLARSKRSRAKGDAGDGGDVPRLSPEEFAFYCGADTCATLLLSTRFTAELQRDDRLWNYYVRVEMPKLRALTRLVARGIYVEPATLGHQWAQAARNWIEAKKKVPVDNPAAPDQVAKWLFEDLGLTPLHHGKKHGSTQEEDINRLAAAHPEVRAILPVRKWARYQTTYFRPINDARKNSCDGRYHPDIHVAGSERRVGGSETSAPVTGRLSSSYHTIPRPTPEDGPFVRQIFTAPEGYELLEAVLEQIEARLCAWTAAGKPKTWGDVVPAHANMLIAFRDNRKIYEEQAAFNLWGDPRQWPRVTKDQRQKMGKVPVLSMGYRISPKGFMEYAWREYQIDWSLKEATRIWLGFHRLWPEFTEWHEREERKLRARGYAVTDIGRIRRLPAAMDWGRAASDAIQAGINSPIQGLASDWTQATLILLDALAEKRDVPLRIVGDVHDALQAEVPKDKVLQGARLMKWAFEVGARAYLEPLGLHIPPGLVKVEVKAGAWGAGRVLTLP
jgi:uracil-DNA glycosylase family 4